VAPHSAARHRVGGFDDIRSAVHRRRTGHRRAERRDHRVVAGIIAALIPGRPDAGWRFRRDRRIAGRSRRIYLSVPQPGPASRALNRPAGRSS